MEGVETKKLVQVHSVQNVEKWIIKVDNKSRVFCCSSFFNVNMGQDFSNIRCRLMLRTLLLHKVHLDIHRTSSFPNVLGLQMVQTSGTERAMSG